MQQSADEAYDPDEAISRGTLFPGLDLPFKNIVNSTMPVSTPKAELMALDFAAHELALYLDTHKDDIEAFETYKSVLALARQGRERYVARYGPISEQDQADAASYRWTDNPWPWDYTGGEA
jgi:spore coat protein JB